MSNPKGHPQNRASFAQKSRFLQLQIIAIALLTLATLPYLGRALSGTYSRNPTISFRSTKDSSRGHPTTNLGNRYEAPASYAGPVESRTALEQNRAQPRSLASADFDEDGVPDLVSGYAYNGRGIISLLRGNIDSIYPNSPEARERQAAGSLTGAPFHSPAQVFDLPIAPDLIGAGDFNGDSHWDIVAATAGGHTLCLSPGDGQGAFGAAYQIKLPGRVTALAKGEINRRDGLTDIVVGIIGPDGPQALVFEGPEGALRHGPEVFDLPVSASSFALGQFDDHYAFDLAIAAGDELVIIQGRDRKLSLDHRQQSEVSAAKLSSRHLQFTPKLITAGDFGGGPLQDLALISDAGDLYFLLQDTSDGPAQTISKWQLERQPDGRWLDAEQLVSAQVSSSATDDLLVLDSAGQQVSAIIRSQPRSLTAAKHDEPEASLETRITSVQVEGAPIAALPMRLDIDALSDLVILRAGVSAPAISRSTRTSLALSGPPSEASIFSNSTSIVLNGSFNPPTPATPYPSSITVSGEGTVTKVRVRLFNFTQSFPPDADLMLAGPGGQTVMLMSDAGGAVGINNALLTFDEEAESFIEVPMGSGTYKPTNVNDGPDAFPTPAPGGPQGASLSVFNGTNPNGTWNLFAVTDTSFPGGSIGGGWSLIFGADPAPTTFVVTNTNDSGAGSLRQAIIDANNNLGPDIITFSIGSGVQTIAPASGLPEIFDPVTIDGTTQPGFAGTPLIEIDGTNADPPPSPNTFGVLTIRSGRCLIRGLAINRFNDNAIAITRNGNNIIEGNFIGTDVTGTQDRGNQLTNGVRIEQTKNNLVGGTTAAARNLISGIAFGVSIFGFSQSGSNNATGNLIQGNFIGTNVNGTVALQNSHAGVVANGAANNTIGGTTPGARNILSGNGMGVDFFGGGTQGNLAQGNFVGTNAAGTGAIPNSSSGIEAGINSKNNLIGGTVAAARNLISGNLHGVLIREEGSSGNLVQGNFIGTTITGATRLGNQRGVFLLFSATGNTVGGAVAGSRNIISGNTVAGIQIGELNRATTLTNVIQGNFIGTDVSGTLPLGNGTTGFPDGHGIIIPANADGDRIEANRIAFNLGAGVRITNVSGTNAAGIRILIINNEIFSNGGLGIDLGDQGITPNDPLDTDTGPNNLQNFPVLTSFAASAAVTGIEGNDADGFPDDELSLNVSGTLNSTPNTNFTVHWYFSADTECISNQAETRPLVTGRIPDVITNSSGNASFNIPFDFPVGIESGIINCTATDPQGNTSEYSACLPVSGGGTPAPTIQFSTTGFNVPENGAAASVTVTRSGDLSAGSTIDYMTSDTAGLNNCNVFNGVANSRCDYITSMGTLQFAAGENSKLISVLIINDSYAEGNENFTITLSNPTGGTLGSPSTATVAITDNESSHGPNPIQDATFFARQHYLDFLNREPDAAGLGFWANEITSCSTDTQCIELRRINVSAAFFLSIEFQETGYLVYRMYKVAYGDTSSPNVSIPVPIIRLNEFLPDAQRIGRGVQVGIGDWQAQLEANKNAYSKEFVSRTRFLSAYSTGMSSAQFVDKLNTNAGPVLSATEKQQLISELDAATDKTQGRASVTRKVAEDPDLKQQENNRAFVLMQYYGYLRRNPNDPPDNDFRGWEFWLNKLNQFNGNFVQAEMVKAFIVSLEYNQRFGP